jgi:hypothetical protein
MNLSEPGRRVALRAQAVILAGEPGDFRPIPCPKPTIQSIPIPDVLKLELIEALTAHPKTPKKKTLRVEENP